MAHVESFDSRTGGLSAKIARRSGAPHHQHTDNQHASKEIPMMMDATATGDLWAAMYESEHAAHQVTARGGERERLLTLRLRHELHTTRQERAVVWALLKDAVRTVVWQRGEIDALAAELAVERDTVAELSHDPDAPGHGGFGHGVFGGVA